MFAQHVHIQNTSSQSKSKAELLKWAFFISFEKKVDRRVKRIEHKEKKRIRKLVSARYMYDRKRVSGKIYEFSPNRSEGQVSDRVWLGFGSKLNSSILFFGR